ncbi:hypothetical protein [Terrabacter sp. NPDC000476]|uniref:hypothetical protein n=1 Tax=Terrabacter sp. NPDC000476 TaxID=3154258 RepID=UPI00331E976E
MTRYAMDADGVSRERLALAHDPAELRACASALAAATAHVLGALGNEAADVRAATERFRLVHAHALDAVAEAADALGGRLDRSVAEARAVELAVTRALADTGGWATGPGAPWNP